MQVTKQYLMKQKEIMKHGKFIYKSYDWDRMALDYFGEKGCGCGVPICRCKFTIPKNEKFSVWKVGKMWHIDTNGNIFWRFWIGRSPKMARTFWIKDYLIDFFPYTKENIKKFNI